LEIAHTATGGVVSTTVNCALQEAVWPVTDVAVKLSDTPVLAYALAIMAEPSALATKPTTVVDEHVAVTLGITVAHVSATVAASVEVPELHSTLSALGQVMVGGADVIASVSLHVAVLPAESVAVQIMTTPLLLKSDETDTLPSALTVQPLQPGGQAQATVAVVQVSEPVAETEMGPDSHAAEAAEMAHWTVGGVVSTTVT
jgi:hypothetical protein